MILNEISLLNFRNYVSLTLKPSKTLNIFYGFNAQGKTNLLEGIYYLATTQSHRAFKDQEMIQWGKDFFKLKGIVSVQDRNLSLEIHNQETGQKILCVGSNKKVRVPDYLGNLCVVLFSPEDLTIIKGSPKERRKFLDFEISQISKSYAHLLIQYYKVLGQRNNLLKNIRDKKVSDDQLEIWDFQLVEIGSKILFKRFSIIKSLAHLAKKNHLKISAGQENLDIKYLCSFQAKPDFSVKEIERHFSEKLRETRTEEINRGITLVGPHRDDLVFYINNTDARLFGSQGQQRSTALSLKLAELDLIFVETGEYPILLLDDVLSELDNIRRHYLLAAVSNKVQTFVTTTNLEFITEELLADALILRVDEGNLIIG